MTLTPVLGRVRRLKRVVGSEPPQDLFKCLVFDRRSSARTPEEHDIAVGVLEFEAAQTVISILQSLGKLDITRRKFRRQCIRIRDVNECVPAGDTFLDVSLVVRLWSYAYVFEQDLRAAPANDAGEDVVSSRPRKVTSNPSRSR
jgi:hypothetical protein